VLLVVVEASVILAAVALPMAARPSSAHGREQAANQTARPANKRNVNNGASTSLTPAAFRSHSCLPTVWGMPACVVAGRYAKAGLRRVRNTMV